MLVACVGFVLIAHNTAAGSFYNLRPLLPPEEYGNILINRLSVKENVLPVAFPHWVHRTKYTCGVCHTELEFSMTVNDTEITHAELRKGRYCGACHNGTTTFSHEGRCSKCHNNDISTASNKFVVYANSKPFPMAKYGNQIDWSQALQRGLIAPRRFLKEEPSGMTLDRTITLEAESSGIPHGEFPHQAHLEWMGCDMCHPEVFDIKKKSTEGFSMSEILKGRFCGACHINVAFPIDDCKKCHPKMRGY